MSHAVEGGNSGSKPLPKDECTPIHMVGGTPTVQARLGGVDVLCVVDSGSMVSFVTEEFYKKKLQPTCGRVRKDGRMLTLRAANGLEIRYLGYLELDVEVDGVNVPGCGVLVLKDTPATAKKRREVPGLLGTNVLAQIPKFGDLLQQRTTAEPRTSGTCTSGFVRVAGKYPVLVPPNSVASVAVTDLGMVRGAAKLTSGDQLKFDVCSNEVIVTCPLGAENQKSFSPESAEPANPRASKIFLGSLGPQLKSKSHCESLPLMQMCLLVKEIALEEPPPSSTRYQHLMTSLRINVTDGSLQTSWPR